MPPISHPTPSDFYSRSHIDFYPDQIRHSFQLAASCDSSRYRYQITKARSQKDFTALLGYVSIDGAEYCSFIRLDFKANWMQEFIRLYGRTLGSCIRAKLEVKNNEHKESREIVVDMPFCHRSCSYATEIWHRLDVNQGNWHSPSVRSLMGRQAPITRSESMSKLVQDFTQLRSISTRFEELEKHQNQVCDNNLERVVQRANRATPNSPENDEYLGRYHLNFQDTIKYIYDTNRDVPDVEYRDAMLDPKYTARSLEENIIRVKWLLQEELGGDCIFAHVVKIPPGAIEGVHLHIGSEEVYYFISGEGLALVGEFDDKQFHNFPLRQVPVLGLGTQNCRELPVGPGSLLYTKSGGYHGIKNTGQTDLVFFAFLQHSH